MRQKKILIILNEQYTTKKSVSFETDFFVVLPGFEPGQTEPKPVVLPLHHRTILRCSLLKSDAKIVHLGVNAK